MAATCVVALSVSSWPARPTLHAQDTPEDFRQLVEGLGVGAAVVITPQAGRELRGQVLTIGSDLLTLHVGRAQKPAEIGWVSIKKVALQSMHYETTGTTDVETVRRILLMAGNEVKSLDVTTRSGARVRGRVENLFENTFAFRMDSSVSRTIRYEDVIDVGPVSHTGRNIAWGVIGGLLVFVGIGALTVASGGLY